MPPDSLEDIIDADQHRPTMLLVSSSPYYEALVQAAWYVTANGKATFSNMFTTNKQSMKLENMLIFLRIAYNWRRDKVALPILEVP